MALVMTCSQNCNRQSMGDADLKWGKWTQVVIIRATSCVSEMNVNSPSARNVQTQLLQRSLGHGSELTIEINVKLM